MLGARGYASKKALKDSVGKPLRYVETSPIANEYKRDGEVFIVGPCERTRKWFAKVTMKDGLIAKVS